MEVLCLFCLGRIVVGSEYVGAIIGKSGQTIKNITQQSRARYVTYVYLYVYI